MQTNCVSRVVGGNSGQDVLLFVVILFLCFMFCFVFKFLTKLPSLIFISLTLMNILLCEANINH